MDEPLVADDVEQSLQESLLSKPIYGIASGNEISSVLQNALPASNPGFRVDPNQINTPFGKVSMNKAIKKTYFKGQEKEWSKYSMRIYPEKADFNHFYYLIIDQNKKGKNRGKIIAMESTQPLNYRNGRANFASFTGLYSVYHLNGDLQIQVPLKNGKLDKAALLGMRAEECEWEMGLVRICVGTPETGGWNNDEEWNTNIDEDCPGGWVWEVDLTLVCSPDDDGGGTGYVPDYPEDPEFPGGPGSGGDPVEEPADIIYEDVEDPCIRQQIEKAINSNFKTKFSSILESIFEKEIQINLIITDKEPLSSDQDGTAVIEGITQTKMDIKISLNKEILRNSTKEYIFGTINHELAHVILFEALRNSYPQEEVEHQFIHLRYFNFLENSLLFNFPNLSTTDKEGHAKALVWGGLQGTNAWKNLGNDTVSIKHINHLYRNSNNGVGTTCN
jgi:hypothetical protein